VPAIVQKLWAKIKYLPPEVPLIVIIASVGVGSFALGRLSVLTEIKNSARVESVAMTEQKPLAIGGLVVASRTGKRYYFPWCANTIAEKNKVWFKDEAAAKAAGYTAAQNCAGLK
jgi:hypothetical protein